MSTRLLTTQQAAISLGFTDSWLRKLVARGKAKPARSIGGTWLFSLKEIERIRTRRKGKGQ